jgi:hypothetical protein
MSGVKRLFQFDFTPAAGHKKEPAAYQPENPLIVQGDDTVPVEVDSPRYVEARDHLARLNCNEKDSSLRSFGKSSHGALRYRFAQPL